MHQLADFIIAVAEAFKTESLVAQISFLVIVVGAPFALLRWARSSLRRERTEALEMYEEVKQNLDDLKTRHDVVRAELEAAQTYDPESFLKDVTPQRRDENMARVQERSEKYLDAMAQAQGAAHVIMTEFHLGRGRRELDEALRHARGAIAAIPRDATARGLLSTVTGRIGEVRKEPETAEERAAESEEVRLAAIIADDDADVMALYRVGDSEFKRGWYRIAAAIWERALGMIAAKDGASSPLALQVRFKIARATLWAGDRSKAERLIRPLPAAMENKYSATAAETLSAKSLSAELDLNLGRPAEAETQLRSIVHLQQIILEAEHTDLLDTQFFIARALLDQGKSSEAEASWRDLLKVFERVVGDEHPDTLSTRFYIALAQLEQGAKSEAEAAFRELLPMKERFKGAEHPDTIATRACIARAQHGQGQVVEAEAALRALSPVERRVIGDEHPAALATQQMLAQTALAQGRFSEAEDALAELAPVAARVLAETDPKLGYIAFLRAQCADVLGDPAAANAYLAEAEANWGDRLTPEHPFRRELAAYLAARTPPQ